MVNNLMCKLFEMFYTNLVFDENSKESTLKLCSKYGLFTKYALCSRHLLNW